MPKNIKAPCIRGLKRYDKTGCPGIAWDVATQTGCPCWTVLTVPDADNPVKKIPMGDCMDQWNLKFNHQNLSMLEGVQVAIESFRNGMVEEVGGDVMPKVDRGFNALLGMISQRKSISG